MLVLTRREGETIVIGDIEVSVVKSRTGKASLGIVAPKNVKILRRELIDRDSKQFSTEAVAATTSVGRKAPR